VTTIVNGMDVGADRAPVDADGRFVVKGLAAGDYEVSVLDDRSSPMRWARPSDAAADGLPVTLTDGQRREGLELVVAVNAGVIRGVVLAPDGKPARDAWVSALPAMEFPMMGGPPGMPGPGGGGDGKDGNGPDGDRTEVRAMVMITDDADGDDGAAGMPGAVPPVLTDADGRFEIRGLRAGDYRLLADGERGTARGSLDKVATGADVSLRLTTLTELAGTVTADGKPVTTFSVELRGPAQRLQRYRTTDGRFLMARIEPGPYTVEITAPEGNGSAEVTIVAGEKATVDIKLAASGKVIGTVVDATGAPVAGRPIVAAAMAPGGATMVQIEGEPPRTAPDGHFELPVKPGKHMLLVLGPDGPAARKEIDVAAGQTLDIGQLVTK
jgi:hypothetical protein